MRDELTDKTVKSFFERGMRLDEIARLTGLKVTEIKKILLHSANAQMRRRVRERIEAEK